MSRVFAIDFETKDLAARHDKNVEVWCVGFAWREAGKLMSTCLPWNAGGKELLSQLNEQKDILFVFHNASFDVAVARTNGVLIQPGKYHCTFLLSYLANPGAEGHSLRDWGIDFDYPKGDCKDWMFGNTDELMEYCKRDTELCLLVFEHLWETEYKKDSKLRDAYLNVELPYVEVIIEMEQTGMFINTSELTELGQYLTDEIKICEETIDHLTGWLPESPSIKWNKESLQLEVAAKSYKKGYHKSSKNAKHYTFDGVLASSDPAMIYDHCNLAKFNPNSAHHLCWCLMKEGWVPEQFSKKSKEPSTTAEVIKEVGSEFSETYTSIATYLKLRDTFVNGILSRTDSNSVVRGSYNQCITRTTRLSSSSPNLQNIPTRSKLGKKVRECVIAPPGYTLLVADLDQIELRVLAYYLEQVMGETRMADGIRAGIDPHTSNATSWGVERPKAKTGIFGKVYGAQPPRLAKTLGCSVEEAEKLITDIDTAMPLLQKLINKVVAAATKRGGDLYTLFGQRLRYPKLCSKSKWERTRAERQCFNSLIQGTAAAINKELTIQAMPILKKYGGFVSFTVHDEVGIWVKENYAEQAIEELNRVYTNTDILRGSRSTVVITGEWHSGANWNEAKAG